jgi:hypothetical protein
LKPPDVDAAMNGDRGRCLDCSHFRNAPEFLEAALRGLSALSSAHASVRKDDGVCLLHDLYLSADAQCAEFRPAPRK